MNKFAKKPIALALGATFALGTAAAQASVFEATDLDAGYMVAMAGDEEKKGEEGKCGEGKCGGDKKDKKAEGKCGEGKCGGDKKDKEGKCGEGKCGEGKCGGDK